MNNEHAAFIAKVYPWEVCFTRTHRKGALAGLPIPVRIGFPDQESATLWAADAANHPEYSDMRVALRPAWVEA